MNEVLFNGDATEETIEKVRKIITELLEGAKWKVTRKGMTPDTGESFEKTDGVYRRWAKPSPKGDIYTHCGVGRGVIISTAHMGGDAEYWLDPVHDRIFITNDRIEIRRTHGNDEDVVNWNPVPNAYPHTIKPMHTSGQPGIHPFNLILYEEVIILEKE
jgi:hypothetical protein